MREECDIESKGEMKGKRKGRKTNKRKNRVYRRRRMISVQ
jgi:hypothetical protein